MRLFTPGPVAVPGEVLQLLAEPPLPHHSAQFRQLVFAIQSRLRELLEAAEPVLLLTCSGTGALEAVASALCPEGSRALVLVNGRFSARCAEILRRLRVQVQRLEAPWGESISPEALERYLESHPGMESVWIVHSETSTGVLQPLQELIGVVRRYCPDAFVCVDAITSFAVHPCPMSWGIDAVVVSSQKALMLPPGLAIVGLSARAWEHVLRHDSRSLYFDLRLARERASEGLTLWTPAVSLVRALGYVLEHYFANGLAPHWERHARNARAVRAALGQLGLRCFGQSGSNALSVVELPEPLRTLPEELAACGFAVGRGQDALAGRVMRIGHMGALSVGDVLEFLAVLEELVRRHGGGAEPGSAVAAAAAVFSS